MKELFEKMYAKCKISEERTGEEILKVIDWDALEQEISDKLGLKVTIEAELSQNNLIRWECNEELIARTDLFRHVFKSVRIEHFNTSYVMEVNKDNTYWCSCHVKWELYSGGTNGAELFRAWFDLNKGTWIIKWIRDKKKTEEAKSKTNEQEDRNEDYYTIVKDGKTIAQPYTTRDDVIRMAKDKNATYVKTRDGNLVWGYVR